MIKCMICHKSFKVITGSHLSGEGHNTTIEKYIKKFPNAKLTSPEFSKSHSGKKNYMHERCGKLNPMYHKSPSKEALAKRSKKVIAEGTFAGKNNGNYKGKYNGTSWWQDEEKTPWNKGLTKKNDKRVLKYSKTIKARILSGEITISPLAGKRFVRSYFLLDDRKINLKSSYELIAAIYFYLRGWHLNYEDTRVWYRGHTYVSDFRFGNNIYEVKGVLDKRSKLSEKAFMKNDYNHRFIFADKIERMREYIISKDVDIDGILDKCTRAYHKGKIYKVRAESF